jgi:hypothetical protein
VQVWLVHMGGFDGSGCASYHDVVRVLHETGAASNHILHQGCPNEASVQQLEELNAQVRALDAILKEKDLGELATRQNCMPSSPSASV